MQVPLKTRGGRRPVMVSAAHRAHRRDRYRLGKVDVAEKLAELADARHGWKRATARASAAEDAAKELEKRTVRIGLEPGFHEPGWVLQTHVQPGNFRYAVSREAGPAFVNAEYQAERISLQVADKVQRLLVDVLTGREKVGGR